MANEFISKYFINPILNDSGYNFVNSIAYALIALILLYGIYKGLQKLNVKVDIKFFYALLPFVFLGSSLRALVDHKIIEYGFWTVSPGIWMLVTGLFLFCFLISWFFAKEDYWKTCIVIGIISVVGLWIVYAKNISFTNTWAGAVIIGIASGISVLLYFIFKFSKAKWFLGMGFLPFIAHMLDASATFVAVDFFGAVEKHPLTRFIGNITGTAASLYFLKLILLLPAVYLIQTQIKNKNLANYLLVAIAVLGLSEGLRDLITIVLA